MERFAVVLISLVAGEVMQFCQSIVQATHVNPLIGLFGGLSALLQVIALFYIYQILIHLKEDAQQAGQAHAQQGD